jgi:hypothetical protein
VTNDDRTLLALLAESLRSRVMTDKQMDLFAAACDRIAGVRAWTPEEMTRLAEATLRDTRFVRTACGLGHHDEEAGP